MQETQEMQVQSLCWEDLLEKEMGTHSSIIAQQIPWAGEPGGLQSMGSQTRWSTHATKLCFIHAFKYFKHIFRCVKIV